MSVEYPLQICKYCHIKATYVFIRLWLDYVPHSYISSHIINFAYLLLVDILRQFA